MTERKQIGDSAPAPVLLAGKYKLISCFAEGGMGELWLAEHVELETTVVVKRLRSWSKEPRALERFRREAKASAGLRGRHVIHVFDFGVEETGPYLVMERLRGRDLGEVIRQDGALSLAQAGVVLDHATKALRVAHAAGIVHRDIKPSNLFVTQEEGEPLVKVLDFGIVKEIARQGDGSSLTNSGALVGSPGYMSPEQVRGHEVDARADVWALGAVVYEMITGRGAFLNEHVGESLARVCSGSFERVSGRSTGLQAGWDRFFEKAFSVDKGRRFQTVDALQQAFLQLVQPSSPALLAPTQTTELLSSQHGATAMRTKTVDWVVPSRARAFEPWLKGRYAMALLLLAVLPGATAATFLIAQHLENEPSLAPSTTEQQDPRRKVDSDRSDTAKTAPSRELHAEPSSSSAIPPRVLPAIRTQAPGPLAPSSAGRSKSKPSPPAQLVIAEAVVAGAPTLSRAASISSGTRPNDAAEGKETPQLAEPPSEREWSTLAPEEGAPARDPFTGLPLNGP